MRLKTKDIIRECVSKNVSNQKKEDSAIAESVVSAGKFTFDDDNTMIISKQDAALINTLFKNVSKTNRDKMKEVLMSDKKGFDEVIRFAKVAL